MQIYNFFDILSSTVYDPTRQPCTVESPHAQISAAAGTAYFRPTTMECGPGSRTVCRSRKPASAIQPRQSAAV
jgi:hypothetical protein